MNTNNGQDIKVFNAKFWVFPTDLSQTKDTLNKK